MDPIKSLSVYRDAVVNSIGTLDDVPDELVEFAAKERKHLEGVVRDVEAEIQRLREAEYANRT